MRCWDSKSAPFYCCLYHGKCIWYFHVYIYWQKSNTQLINSVGKLEYYKEQYIYVILFKLISLKSLSLSYFINPLLSGVLFLYLLKTSENHRFSDIFRGCKKGAPGSNGLRKSRYIKISVHLQKIFVQNREMQNGLVCVKDNAIDNDSILPCNLDFEVTGRVWSFDY